MFGEGISLTDLMGLLAAIRAKNLVLQVKITDGDWRTLSNAVIADMVETISSGKIGGANDIRCRLTTP